MNAAASALLVVRRRPVDFVFAGWYGLLLTVVAIDVGKLPVPMIFLGLVAAGFALSLAIPRLAERAGEGNALSVRILLSLVLVPLAFELVGRIVPYVSPDARDGWLRRADVLLFGSDPTRWSGERERWPWLTEILQWIYASFYFLPLLLAARLAALGKRAAIERTMTVIVLGFLLSYLGYFLVPVRSPYHFYRYPFEFEGLFATPAIRRAVDFLEGVKYDCFPSGHSQLTMLTAALAWKYDRKSFRAFFGPIGVTLPLSTVYLRYHYAADVIAAVAFALLTWWLAALLERACGSEDRGIEA